MNSNLENLVGKTSGVCVGLDPDPSKLPIEFEARVLPFLQEIVNLTSSKACAYKIQKAFFDVLDGGSKTLSDVVSYIKEKTPSTPIILDCKIGDIDNTMQAYVENVFDKLKVDAVVVNPYMGHDVFSQFDSYSDRGIVTLIRTSNEGASVIQDAKLENGQSVWSYMLDVAVSQWNKNGNLIPVLSGYANLKDVRERIPDEMPILYAGVGAQGGTLEGVKYLFNSQGGGVFVNSSRGILYSYERDDPNWRDSVVKAASKLAAEINNFRGVSNE